MTRRLVPIAYLCLAAAFAVPAEAALDYERNRETICGTLSYRDCDLRVEALVLKQIPGVVQRRGDALRIRARNGKTIVRKDSAPGVPEPESWNLWACDYLSVSGYLKLCYRLWESSRVDYINLATGALASIRGLGVHSPSQRQVFIVHAYVEVFRIDVWRLGKERPVRVFSLESPPGLCWGEGKVWTSENQIVEGDCPEAEKGVRHSLTKQRGRWVLRPLPAR